MPALVPAGEYERRCSRESPPLSFLARDLTSRCPKSIQFLVAIGTGANMNKTLCALTAAVLALVGRAGRVRSDRVASACGRQEETASGQQGRTDHLAAKARPMPRRSPSSPKCPVRGEEGDRRRQQGRPDPRHRRRRFRQASRARLRQRKRLPLRTRRARPARKPPLRPTRPVKSSPAKRTCPPSRSNQADPPVRAPVVVRAATMPGIVAVVVWAADQRNRPAGSAGRHRPVARLVPTRMTAPPIACPHRCLVQEQASPTAAQRPAPGRSR